MSELTFDHDRLDVYRLSIRYTSEAFQLSKELSGLHRHARDQWRRAANFLSKYVSGKRFASAVRDHWGIENSLHWPLDVTFGEDHNRKGRGSFRNTGAQRQECVRLERCLPLSLFG